MQITLGHAIIVKAAMVDNERSSILLLIILCLNCPVTGGG